MACVIGLRRSTECGAIRESPMKGLNLKGGEDFQSEGSRGKSGAADESNSYEQSAGLWCQRVALVNGEKMAW